MPNSDMPTKEQIEAVRADIAKVVPQPEYDDGSAGPVLVRLAWVSTQRISVAASIQRLTLSLPRFLHPHVDMGENLLLFLFSTTACKWNIRQEHWSRWIERSRNEVRSDSPKIQWTKLTCPCRSSGGRPREVTQQSEYTASGDRDGSMTDLSPRHSAGLQHARVFLEPIKEKHPWISYSEYVQKIQWDACESTLMRACFWQSVDSRRCRRHQRDGWP